MKKDEQKILSTIDTLIKPIDRTRYIGFEYEPGITMPECRPFGEKHKILLTADWKIEYIRAVYQLAHECIHLISPVPKEQVLYFEEGLAVKFQDYWIRKHHSKERIRNVPYFLEARKALDHKYKSALESIEYLQSISNKSIYTICHELFKEGAIKTFSDITLDILKMKTPKTSDIEKLQLLTMKFYEHH